MHEERVERIAREQARQRSASPAIGAGDGVVGAYWPLGESAPDTSATAGRAEIVSVWAEGPVLNLALRPRGDEPTVVQIDLSRADDPGDDDLVHTLVLARLAELVASDRWARRREIAAPLVLTL